MKIKNCVRIFLGLIILIAALLRFSQLGAIPAGLTNDEADIGYDAYSILKTGKDQWGEFLPLVSFKGFGDYRLPLYTYLTAPSIAFFGLNSFAVRFPSALFGVATVLLTFLLARSFFNDKIALLASFLLSISPWHFVMSRIGIESNLAVFLVVLAIYLFYQGLKKPHYFFSSFFILILSFYTYYSIRLFIPLLFSVLFLSERKKLLSFKKEIILSLSLCFLLSLPIFFSLFQASGQTRIKQLGFTKEVGFFQSLRDKRGECSRVFYPVVCRLIYNQKAAFITRLATNYLNHFSTKLLFVTGSYASSAVMPSRGLLYLFEAPFLLFGLYFLFKNQAAKTLFFSWLIFAPVASSLTGEEHLSRMLVFLPSFQIITACGLYYFFQKIKITLHSIFFKTLVFAISTLCFISFLFFLADYFLYFPAPFSKYSDYGYQELFTYLYQEKDNYDKIYLSRKYHDTKHYIFYLFFNQYDPRKFQSKENVTYFIEENGWIKVSRVNNLFFVDTVPASEDLPRRSLIVADPKELTAFEAVKNIYDLKGETLFKAIKLSVDRQKSI